MAKLSPFDFIGSINDKSSYLITDEGSEKQYLPFIVNRGFSYFKDSVLFANEMNMYPATDKKMQYDFYYHGLSKRKRFSKWFKYEESEEVSIIKEFYSVSTKRAEEMKDLISNEDLEYMKARLSKGGLQKGKSK